MPRFLNTAELRLDGVALGDELSSLWRRGQLAKRQARVEEIVSRLAKGLTERDTVALSAAADSATMAMEPGKARATVNLAPLGTTWRVMMSRRGLEWLVRDIQRR